MTTPSFQPLLGFSLHKLDPSPAAEVFEVVQVSRIDTFEIFFDLFQGPRGKEIRGLYENMLERSGKRTATVHASYGPEIDLSASDPAVRAGALDSTMRAMELAAELGYSGPFNFECTPPGETPVQRLRTLEHTFDWLRGLVS